MYLHKDPKSLLRGKKWGTNPLHQILKLVKPATVDGGSPDHCSVIEEDTLVPQRETHHKRKWSLAVIWAPHHSPKSRWNLHLIHHEPVFRRSTGGSQETSYLGCYDKKLKHSRLKGVKQGGGLDFVLESSFQWPMQRLCLRGTRVESGRLLSWSREWNGVRMSQR